MFGLSKKNIAIIQEILTQFPEIEKAQFFGSRAMENHKKGSDVDIVVYGKNITFDIISQLHGKLEDESPLPYFFDVLHYETLDSKNLIKHIDMEGKTFYSKS